MKQLVIYIHGKGGNAGEARRYRPLFPKSTVLGFDYKAGNPWEAKEEFSRFYDLNSEGYDSVILIAVSIGAYFSLCSLGNKKIAKALLISPVTDMEKLICDMMVWAGTTEEELKAKGEIPTAFGETLSWEYLCYVRSNPVRWNVPTCVLYGENDNMVSRQTVTDFAEKTGASLTVMENGEHWFHTERRLEFLDNWVKNSL